MLTFLREYELDQVLGCDLSPGQGTPCLVSVYPARALQGTGTIRYDVRMGSIYTAQFVAARTLIARERRA